MKIKRFTEFSNLPITHDKWNTWVAQNETNTIFQTYEWHTSWWQTFGHEHELCMLFVYDNDEVIGLAPLMIVQKTKHHRELVFIGDNNADYLDFILPVKKQQALTAIWKYNKENICQWDTILLRNIPTESSTLTQLNHDCRINKQCHIINESITCPTHVIKDQEIETRKLINKYSNKRSYNYFSHQGKLSLRHLSASEAHQHLPIFFDQHIRRWENSNSPSLFNKNINQEFYKNLSDKLESTNWLLFSIAELNGKPLSYHFGFDYADKIIWYKPSFDIKQAKHSPGKLILCFLLKYALENNKTELDFTIGNEPFKSRFSNKIRYNANIYVFRSPVRFWIQKTRQWLVQLTKFLLNRTLSH